VSGGCKNGKSFVAQRLAGDMARDGGKLYYIATMRPADEEDERRILRHRRERDGWGFETVEQPERILEIAGRCDVRAAFLLDSVTALLSNEMFRPEGTDIKAAERVRDELAALLGIIENIVVVSDCIYSSAERYDPLTEEFRRSLALVDRAAAARCDTVAEVSFSCVTVHKGSLSRAAAGDFFGGTA
jgi:adenosylcobinamide kinase/adenosylcobinamide-phosphate guanylyltransferase